MVFYWSLSSSKSPQVSRTLLSILADLNNVIVWMVSIRPLISKSFSPCTTPLLTVLSAPITIGITVTFMFHSFFNSLARSRNLSLFLFSFISLLMVVLVVVTWNHKIAWKKTDLGIKYFKIGWHTVKTKQPPSQSGLKLVKKKTPKNNCFSVWLMI